MHVHEHAHGEYHVERARHPVALNVDTLAPFLERTFGFEFMDRDVYYITQIPSDVQTLDVVLIGIVAFLLTVLATIYPAVRAARTEPAEALRYE